MMIEKTVEEELADECARVWRVRDAYLALGAKGRDAAELMSIDIDAAEDAMDDRDATAMIGCLTKLRGWKS